MAYIITVLLLMLPFNAFAGTGLKKASFIPQWIPQAQFAGYYVAHEKGIYKKYGIDLAIIQGGPDRSPALFLKGRKADFASLWLSTAIQERSQGVRLINVAQIVQKSALMLVAKKSSGIKTPADLNGRKVGVLQGDFAIQPHAFFKRYNLNVKAIPQSYSMNLFLRGGVDAASAMLYNEYHTIINSGINPDELTVFSYHEHGLNFPEDGIYVLEDFFKKEPDLSCSFVKASIEGWLYAFSHIDEAVDIVMKHIKQAKMPANRMHQKWMLESMKGLVMPAHDRNDMGLLRQADYELVSTELKKAKLINAIVPFEDFYKRCGN